MLSYYRAGWSLRQLLTEGFHVPGKVSHPATAYMSAAIGQIVNFWRAAKRMGRRRMFSSFDTPYGAVCPPTLRATPKCGKACKS